MDIAQLEQRWRNLFPTGETITVKKEWQCVQSRYSERHRHYHNLHHIAACLQWLDDVHEHVNDARAVELAIWFHDLVYNPRRQDNESISAEYAVSTLSLMKEPRAVRDAVKDLILVTRHPSKPATPDQAWMMDIDLTILGATPSRYDAYASQVRKEYGHVPEPAYRMGRSAVLQSLLDEPELYHTAFFRERMDAAARDNMARELAGLT